MLNFAKVSAASEGALIRAYMTQDKPEPETLKVRGVSIDGRDLETGERLSVNPRGLADEYRKVFGAFLEQYQKGCAGMNIDYRLVRTDQALESFVRAYLEERRRLSR